MTGGRFAGNCKTVLAVEINDGRGTFGFVSDLAVPCALDGVKSAGALIVRPNSAVDLRDASGRGRSTKMFRSLVEIDINVRSVSSLGRSFTRTFTGVTSWTVVVECRYMYG